MSGAQKIYLSWDVPKCNDGCSDSWLGDGYCDVACNVSKCGFDFPDCVNKTTESEDLGTREGRRSSGKKTNKNNAFRGKETTMCEKGCPDSWIGDNVCDTRCNRLECAWDGGDCGLDKIWDALPGAELPSLDWSLWIKSSSNAAFVGTSRENSTMTANKMYMVAISDGNHLEITSNMSRTLIPRSAILSVPATSTRALYVNLSKLLPPGHFELVSCIMRPLE